MMALGNFLSQGDMLSLGDIRCRRDRRVVWREDWRGRCHFLVNGFGWVGFDVYFVVLSD
jgi:hypothetical protein